MKLLMEMVDDDEDGRSPSPEPVDSLQIWPPDEEQEVAAAWNRKTWWNFLSYFFLRKKEFIELELGSAQPQGALYQLGHARGGGATWCLVGSRIPSNGYFL